MESMCATVVDRVNNADRKVEKPPLTLTKYRVQQNSSSSSSPSPANGNGKAKAIAKAKAGGEVLEVVPEDSERRQLEVWTTITHEIHLLDDS